MHRIKWKGRAYTAQMDETVLDALIRGGAEIAFSCKKGTCQTCIMQALSGEPDQISKARLRPELQASNHFLPCLCVPKEDMSITEPDMSALALDALIAETEWVRPHILRLRLEPEMNISWKPGQYVRVGNGSDKRSYSIASLPDDDYFLELHVQVRENGAVSRWLSSLSPNDVVKIEGPLGEMHWKQEWQDRRIVVIATGTGIPPMWGLIREALKGVHGPISFFAGVRDPEDLWLYDDIVSHVEDDFLFVPCCSGPIPAGTESRFHPGRAEVVAFKEPDNYRGAVLLLCGNPGMVENARSLGVLCSMRRADIFTDPFEDSAPIWPNDRALYDSLGPYPELWEALGEGELLRRVLEAFYDEIFEDELIAPYFQNVTKEWAISKQYEFLAAMFRGDHNYFGMLPFNAHHWMIISDELFDYREAIFERYLRDFGVCEEHVRLWGFIHEKFRSVIVKSKSRGMIWGDRELAHEGFSTEVVEVATLCDGCHSEMLEGSHGVMHRRTGQLFCELCSADEASTAF